MNRMAQFMDNRTINTFLISKQQIEKIKLHAVVFTIAARRSIVTMPFTRHSCAIVMFKAELACISVHFAGQVFGGSHIEMQECFLGYLPHCPIKQPFCPSSRKLSTSAHQFLKMYHYGFRKNWLLYSRDANTSLRYRPSGREGSRGIPKILATI